MTTEEKLAAIEALPEGTYRDTKGIGWHGTVVLPSQLEWLIAEVRRLQGEYARGRADERRDVVAWLSSEESDCRARDYNAIERGEHLETTDATN